MAPCGQTCQDLARPEACGIDGGGDLSRDECVEGCACPPDTYLDTQTDLCVPRQVGWLDLCVRRGRRLGVPRASETEGLTGSLTSLLHLTVTGQTLVVKAGTVEWAPSSGPSSEASFLNSG